MRIKNYLRVFLALALQPLTAIAQTDSSSSWDHDLLAGINLSQVSFTNWAAGGSNSINYVASLNGKSVQDVEATNWSTGYKLTYGQAKLGDADMRKTDDEINLESVLTYKWGVNINPYGAVSFVSQFAPGYHYTDTSRTEISNLFDPAYIKQSVGVGFKLLPELKTRLGVGVREILASRHVNFTDDPVTPNVETTKIEGGFESVSELDWAIDTNVIIRSKAELFSPIVTPDRMSFHGSIGLLGRVSRFITAEINALFLNEPFVSPYTQIKEGISIGITYTMF